MAGELDLRDEGRKGGTELVRQTSLASVFSIDDPVAWVKSTEIRCKWNYFKFFYFQPM